MSDQQLQLYQANCHCNAVKLELKLFSLLHTRVNRCNCSICTRNGYLLVYPRRKDVVITSGKEFLTQYRFGNKQKPHNFCSKCGTSMFIDFSESPNEIESQHLAMNIRAIQNIEELLPQLDLRDVDGKNKLDPPYNTEAP